MIATLLSQTSFGLLNEEYFKIAMTDTPSSTESGQQTPEIQDFSSEIPSYSWIDHDDGYYPVTPPDRDDLGDEDQRLPSLDVAPINSEDEPLVAVM